MWSIFLTSAYLVSCCAGSFTVDQYVGVSFELHKRFHAVSWFLVSNDTLASQRQVALVHKGLAAVLGKVKVTQISIENLNQLSGHRSSENRPVFVLFHGEATKMYLKLQHKIPAYPRWLLFLDSASALGEYFERVHVPFDCELLVAVQLGSEIRLTEIFRVAEDFRLNAVPYGTWGPGSGLEATDMALYERRNNLEGIALKALCMEYLPELMISKDSGQAGLYVEGLYGLIWNAMQTVLNFSTVLVEVPVGDFGTLRNGTWTGMLSQVLNREVDVGLNGFTYDNDRMAAVSYLTPILLSRAQLYVLKPTAGLSRWDGFLAPFAGSLWIGVLAGVVVSGVWLAASFHIGRRLGVEECVHEEIDLSSALFHVFAIYCAQSDSSCAPRAASSRAVLLLAGLCAAVVCAAYASALTSSLAVDQPVLAHQSIKEFIDDDAYEIEMSPSAFWIYVGRPRNDLLRTLYKRMSPKADEMPSSRLAGVLKLCESTTPYGWFATKNIPSEFLREHNCEIVPVPGHLVVNTESMIVAKDSPYKRLFNNYVNIMRSTGVLEVMRLRSWPSTLVNADRGSPKVQLRQVLPTFGILAAGVAVGVLLLCQEVVLARGL